MQRETPHAKVHCSSLSSAHSTCTAPGEQAPVCRKARQLPGQDEAELGGDLVTCVLGPRLLVIYATASQKHHGKLAMFPTPFEVLEQQFRVHVNVNF